MRADSLCGGSVKVIARIEDPVLIKKILTHLKEKKYQGNPFSYP
jgi:hypothetical protein